jgi:uncharacterized membrane protein YjdF
MTIRLRLAMITAAFCSAATAVYAVAGVEPVPILAWFLGAGPVLMVILWVYQDAQRRRIAAVTDLGFFLMLFWPIAIPWYAFKSRGRDGWTLLLGLLAIIFAPALTGLILYWFGTNQS